MNKKTLQNNLLKLVKNNPDIPKSMQMEIVVNIDKFTIENLSRMIKHIVSYYQSLERLYNQANRDLKTVAKKAERDFESMTSEQDREKISQIRRKIKASR